MRWTQQQYDDYQRRMAKPAPVAAPAPVEEPKKQRSDLGKKRPRHFQKCEHCGSEFSAPKSKKRKFCSRKCAYENPSRSSWIKPKDRGVGTCAKCGKEFKIETDSGLEKFCSRHCAIAKTSLGTHGWVNIGPHKIYTRSKWESNYARYLEWLASKDMIKSWEYEPDTFWFENIKRGVRSYLPDFKVTNNDGSIEYHEVKGWMDPRSKTKLKRMKKYHPTVKLVLIDSERYKGIAKTVSHIVPDWQKTK